MVEANQSRSLLKFTPPTVFYSWLARDYEAPSARDPIASPSKTKLLLGGDRAPPLHVVGGAAVGEAKERDGLVILKAAALPFNCSLGRVLYRFLNII